MSLEVLDFDKQTFASAEVNLGLQYFLLWIDEIQGAVKGFYCFRRELNLVI